MWSHASVTSADRVRGTNRVVNRREILRLLALAPAFALACRGAAGVTPVSGPTNRVVIVGAGLAGLVLAGMLRSAGIEVVVLEARDRIGGRVHTIELAGATIDLGAAWIHGRSGNPLAELVDELGLATREHAYDPLWTWDAIAQRRLDAAEQAAALAGEDGLFEALASLQDQLGEQASMQDAIDVHLATLGLDADAERHVRFVLEQYVLEVDYGGPSEQTSLAIFDEDEFFGYDDHLVAGGFVELIERLAEGLDIQTSTRVDEVGHDASKAWVVTEQGERYEADRVVVTVPLGVLQAGVIAFEPALPAIKQAALGRMQMSNLEKVVLRFEQVFWPAEPDAAWLHIGSERGEFPLIIDFTADAGAPTLVLVHGGARVREHLDAVDDDSLVAEALALLAVVLDSAVPTPVASHVTRWRSDPHARGSYSFPALGQSLDDFDALAEPVGERVLFAGEATSRAYFGTLHGALLSARREATRLGL